jgi:hypothetical protein
MTNPDLNTIDVDDDLNDAEDGENWNLPNTKASKKVTPNPFSGGKLNPAISSARTK